MSGDDRVFGGIFFAGITIGIFGCWLGLYAPAKKTIARLRAELKTKYAPIKESIVFEKPIEAPAGSVLYTAYTAEADSVWYWKSGRVAEITRLKPQMIWYLRVPDTLKTKPMKRKE